MNLTITLPNKWKPNDKKAFLKWMMKIKSVHYSKVG